MAESCDGTKEPHLKKLFYRDKPEWKDVTPIPQNDGPYEVVKINYTEEFEDVFDYFRAILSAYEISQRAFDLTTDAAAQNPANYTVWHYRRILLKELGLDLRKELTYMNDVILENPKNYQVWHHRQQVVKSLGDPEGELNFIAEALADDTKNYHAWQYRQWVIREFGLWEEELDYVHFMLTEDLLNNSAWNQRYYVISRTTGYTDDVIAQEIKYTKNMIDKRVNNESAWSYLRGILLEKRLSDYPDLMDYCQSLVAGGTRSPFPLSFQLEFFEEQLQHGTGDASAIKRQAHVVCQKLADDLDEIRCRYWHYRQRLLDEKYGPCDEDDALAAEAGDAGEKQS